MHEWLRSLFPSLRSVNGESLEDAQMVQMMQEMKPQAQVLSQSTLDASLDSHQSNYSLLRKQQKFRQRSSSNGRQGMSSFDGQRSSHRMLTSYQVPSESQIISMG